MNTEMDSFLFVATVAFVTFSYQRSRSTTSMHQSKLGNASSSIPTEQLRLGTSLDAQERVCTVSAADNVPIDGGHVRSEMRLKNLWHRATYIVIRHEAPHVEQHEDTYILVQKRSAQKDYFPGKYDPTPGGVVGYNEPYYENAKRELQEEMGIDCQKHPLKRLFTFPYEDSVVRVWGEVYECTYKGTLKDLKIQVEEVDAVLRMSLQELQDRIKASPSDFLPDSLHAMKLYIQHLGDLKINRRFLKGSSSDLDRYRVRPRPQVIFFDCDDNLYFDGWKTARKLTAKIDEECMKMGLEHGQAYQLFKQYGTALRGLLAEGYLEEKEEAIDDFLAKVHDIGVKDLIQPDSRLRAMLQRMDPSIPRYIFTASVHTHAQSCIEALGIADQFMPTIIDTKKCNFESKHSQHSFRVAMQVAGITDPEACIFFDDSTANIEAARQIGWRAVLVGRVGRDSGQPITSEHAELEIDTIHEIEKVCPELFDKL